MSKVIESNHTPHINTNRSLSASEAADYMGISERLLRHLIANRDIRHIRIGRRVILRPEDLDQFLEERAVGGD
jgi:excisionase family DNA binding protein